MVSRIFLPLVMILTACATTPTPTPTPITPGIWEGLLEASPYPHEFPLPEPVVSAMDGTYAKIGLSPPQWWTCYRCADYRPMGGIWRIQFERGVMRIYYEVTKWKSIASFTVSGSRLKIFNDPFCPHEVGEYEWSLSDGDLSLTPVNDTCAFNLREENLTKQSWTNCPSAGTQPEGCSDPLPPSTSGPVSGLPFTVTVHAGDSHYFTHRPEVIVPSNPEDVPSPAGIEIHYHPETIEFGTQRVLWKQGDWIEATTSLPFTSIGVQLWGSGYLGWARVLFDGIEVWRGPTASLGKKYAYYGGYIEITDFTAGTHTIRVESLAFDYHPIKVYSFGFSNQTVEK